MKFPAKTGDLSRRWCSAYLKICVADTVVSNLDRLGELEELGGKRHKFPAKGGTHSGRWCSGNLKAAVQDSVTANLEETKRDKKILIVSGERRGESAGRSKYNEMEIHRTNAEAKAHRIVHQWRCCIDYSEKDVWELLKRHHINPHPCYRIGWNRCSCMMCIFSTPRLFAGVKELFPDDYAALRHDEEVLGFTLDNKKNLDEFIGDTQSSAIPNKGIHAAYKKLRLAVDTVPEEMTYCLKIDCKKFYPSIDHETLKQKFRRKYKDPELLELIDEVIDSISTCPATDENIEFYRSCGNEIKIVKVNGKDFIEGVGIPIGNYFSQYDGNFFLSGFDHWIKEVKRVKHYYRYMNDICIFARTKEELHQLLAEINEYFIQNLKLRIKGNYQIFPSFIRGIDFVGYRIFLKDTLLRKSTCQEFERKMTAIRKKIESGQEMNYSEWCAINSYKGWLKYCDSSRLSEKYIEPIQPYADRYYKDHIKKGGKKHEKVRKSTQYKAA